MEEKKRIRIVWSSVKINFLLLRKMQCFRCLRLGHTKTRCDDKTDREDLCYNCEQEGHRASL